MTKKCLARGENCNGTALSKGDLALVCPVYLSRKNVSSVGRVLFQVRAQVSLVHIYIIVALHVLSVLQAVRVYERDASDVDRRTFVPGGLIVINSTELRMPGTLKAPQPLLMARLLAMPGQLQPSPPACPAPAVRHKQQHGCG